MEHMHKQSLVCFFVIFSLLILDVPAWPDISVEANPRGVAINPAADTAVVADEKADTVSLVELNSQKVIATIPVGKAPGGTAIDNGLNIAIVANSKDDTVSLIDMTALSVVKTIPVGKEPQGPAVNQSTHQALVANHQDNSVAVIDLVNYTCISVLQVGQGPIDVSIDEALNIGLVVNEKDHSLSVIDLTAYKVIAVLSLANKPFAVDINSERHIAAITNEKDNSITVVDLRTWQTSTVKACKHPIDVAVNSLDNRALVVCDEDRSLLLIDLDTKSTVQSYALEKLPKGVAISNFTNVAAVADDRTDSLTLIQLPNPAPIITFLNPSEVYRGSSGENISVKGNGFLKTSILSFNDKLLTTIFVDNHHAQAGISKDLLINAGSFQMTVKNPGPAGGISNNAGISLINPVPAITVLDPLVAAAGSLPLSLKVYGAGFFDDTTLYINGMPRPFNLTSRTKLQSELTSSDLETGAYLGVTAANPQPGGGLSNKADFAVLNPVPLLSSAGPISAVAGGPDVTLSLIGNNFVKTSIVSFNDRPYPIKYVSRTQIETTIPAEAVKTAGNYPVEVINPAPGGGKSSLLRFPVKPPLEITITAPGAGTSINKAMTMVRGAFKSDTNDIGVVVNGIIAELSGKEWIANGVPLTVGTNVIIAIVADSFGNSSSASITVNTSDTTRKVKLSANITSGIAPLGILFSATTGMPNQIGSYQMDFNGDGVVDYTGAAFDNMTYTYTTEGVYYPAVTVTDIQGNTYSDTVAVTVTNKAEIEALLKTKWERMKEALKKKDTESALGYFVERSKEKYRPVFEALKDQLPAILNTFVEFNVTDVYEYIAEYEIVANENGVLFSYPGLLVKDGSGIWKFRDL